MADSYLNKTGLAYLWSKITSALSNKVDKVSGKGLSTNDYTTTEKNKLAGIASGAEVNVQSDWNQTTTTADDYIKNKPTIPSKTSQLTNDSNYVTTDTKNTAGSTDSSSKLFLIGATSQAANPQTYSQDTAYVGTNGHLYSNSKQVVNLSDAQTLTNKTLSTPTVTGTMSTDAIHSSSNITAEGGIVVNGVVQGENIPNGFYIASQSMSSTSGASNTVDLDGTGHDFLVIVTRQNTTVKSGMYIVQNGASNKAVTAVIAAPTTLVSELPTVSGNTLTIKSGTAASGGRITIIRIR